MSLNTPPSASPYHPTTFQERGVALPFTTPQLGGARVRLSHNRGVELIVRNLAGGRGVYVMPLTAMSALCRPTLFDKVVCNRVAFLETVTPATVRAIARATAAEGLAGEGAMQAAHAAAKTEACDRRAVVHHLLSCLVRQVHLDPDAPFPVPGPNSPDLDTRARQIIDWLAPRLGQSTGWTVKAVNALADAMTGIGVIAGAESGRLPGLVSRLGTMRGEIAEWANTHRDADRVLLAHSFCSISDFTRSVAATMITETRMLVGDMVRLLRQWAADPASVVRVAARPEWMLDGWEQICLIWGFAQDNAARRVALVEIANYIPVIPKELRLWGGGRANMADLFTEHAHIALNEDWCTGAALYDLVARNEQLRAVAA
jgi:hypothetical protein